MLPEGNDPFPRTNPTRPLDGGRTKKTRRDSAPAHRSVPLNRPSRKIFQQEPCRKIAADSFACLHIWSLGSQRTSRVTVRAAPGVRPGSRQMKLHWYKRLLGVVSHHFVQQSSLCSRCGGDLPPRESAAVTHAIRHEQGHVPQSCGIFCMFNVEKKTDEAGRKIPAFLIASTKPVSNCQRCDVSPLALVRR